MIAPDAVSLERRGSPDRHATRRAGARRQGAADPRSARDPRTRVHAVRRAGRPEHLLSRVGSEYDRICAQPTGYICSDPTCVTRLPRPRCEASSEGGNEDGCLWGLGPVEDYNAALRALANAPAHCLKGYTGAHGFVFQSMDQILPDFVHFTRGRIADIGCGPGSRYPVARRDT